MAESITTWSNEYDDYLRDESRRTGSAVSISFPKTERGVVEIINQVSASGGFITTQGARTGIAAGAVPDGGHVMNLGRMNSIGEMVCIDASHGSLIVQPGALLSEVNEAVDKAGLFFPPDPTETTASIGGMVACNASGAMSYHYGPTRNWIKSMRVALADGSILQLVRGENHAQGRSISVTTDEGRIIQATLPAYAMPRVKSAAGYFCKDDMDIIDLFIGMEGTLGIITEIEISLIPKPTAIAGLTVFLPSQDAALDLVRCVRGESIPNCQPIAPHPVAIEYFNADALNLLRDAKSQYSAFAAIPAIGAHFYCAVYLEFHGNTDEAIEESVTQVMEAAVALGGNDEDTWYASTERELEPIKAFRHATPEAVNLLIGEKQRDCPGLTKLGTDMSVPDAHLNAVMAMYDAGLQENQLDSVVFGHIGNNHVHVNILPSSIEEYDKGKALYASWAKEVVAMGGSVSAEHGIGKLKTGMLELMYGRDGILQMRQLKKLFDPNMLLNPCVLFEA